VRREFQNRYRNSLLGAAWNVINPLAMIIVYTVVFSQVIGAKLPYTDKRFAYSIYLCAGVLFWNLFVEITERAKNVFLDNANLLKKLNFPHLCLPMIVVLSALLNFAIIFGLFTVFLLATGNFPGLVYVAILPLLCIQIAFSIGLGIILGVLNVFFRDVGQLFGVVVMFWFWMTPIVYTLTTLPKTVQDLMRLNPMAALVNAYQAILLGGLWPDWKSLWLVGALAVVFCLLGFRLFRAHSGEMVDEL
jgi:lipopolysaccharide transport system permease protein